MFISGNPYKGARPPLLSPTVPLVLLRQAMVLGLAVGALSCARKQIDEKTEVFPVTLPGRSAAHYEREYVGEVQALQRAEIRARTKGRIESVHFDEGQSVKPGQRLFSISAKELHQELRRARAAVASAAAELKTVELEYSNMKMLLEKHVVSAAEVALADAKVQLLSAKLEEARANEGQASIQVGYSEVRAPFAGVVNRVPKKAGSLVDEGDLLTTVTNAAEVLIYFRVSEQEYLAYADPQKAARTTKVSFKMANGEVLPAVGVMDAAENEFDRNTGTIAFRARFANDRQILKHGSSGKILVKTQINDDAVTIPQKSTFEVQDHVYVYVVDQDGKARARRIFPKLRMKEVFVVESGIKAGERFIAEGVQKVQDGTAVAIRMESTRPGGSTL